MEIIKLTNGTEYIIDFECGAIDSIVHNGVRLNYGKTAMFSVKLRKKDGNSFVVSANDCKQIKYKNGVAEYVCEFFELKLSLKIKGCALVWKTDIKNKTSFLLEWVELMSFDVCGKLCDEKDGRGEIIYPYNEGVRVTNMAYRESMPFSYSETDYPSKNTYSVFPNMVFAQFISYLCSGFGVYLGMHDSERTTKHIDFCYDNDNIKVFMRTFSDVDYGEDYSMPFDSVLTVFEGEWQDAAEIYRKWFYSQKPYGLKKISENTALPKWYGQSPLVVTYPLRGKNDTDMSANGMYPYVNAIPYLEDIKKQTDSKVMALIMQWEGTAPWAPPYIFPPYGGIDEFSDFVNKMHRSDMLVGLYSSGLGWTQQSCIDKEYNRENEFTNSQFSKLMCADSNGEIASTTCKAQRKGYDFCPAPEESKEIFKSEFDKVCKSGVDYIQALDQNHGGNCDFCYSDQHGHTPAPGKWQQIEVNKLLNSIDKNGVLLGCESAAAEPFLAELQFSDNRFELNYYLGEPIPVYSYLFHEFVNNFMGNQICSMLEKKENNFTYRLAYSFIAGDMLTVVLNGCGELQYSWCDYTLPCGKVLDKKIVYPFIKVLNSWRNNGGKSFLHTGKSIKPIKVKCGKERFLTEDGKTYLTVDEVLCSAYECEGQKAQFIVNYNLRSVEIELEKACDVYYDSELKSIEKDANKIILKPLSVAMITLE